MTVRKKVSVKKKAVVAIVEPVVNTVQPIEVKPEIGILHNRNIFSVMIRYDNSAIQVPPKGVAKKIEKSKIQMALPDGIAFIGGC